MEHDKWDRDDLGAFIVTLAVCYIIGLIREWSFDTTLIFGLLSYILFRIIQTARRSTG